MGSKKLLPKQNHVADSLCRWVGDGVSRPLPHGILDTSEDTQVRGFPQKSGLVCAWTFLYLSRSVAGARGVRFRREPTSLTFLRGKYERKLFLKSQKLFLKSWKLFLKSQKLFLKSQKLFLKSWKLFLKSWKLFLKYFLNPRNYFLIWAPNPETIYKTRIAFTNPNHWTRIAVNHLKSRDCPRQVSHVLTERERGCHAGTLHSVSFYVHSVSFYVLWLLISESVTVSFLLFNL